MQIGKASEVTTIVYIALAWGQVLYKAVKDTGLALRSFMIYAGIKHMQGQGREATQCSGNEL